METRWPAIKAALAHVRYADAMRELSALSKPVDRFFTEVLVMADDPAVRAIQPAAERTLHEHCRIGEMR